MRLDVPTLQKTTMAYRILLVDDEADILEFIRYNLEKEGYEVFTASNGREAIETALRVVPHLILLDVMMPEMDGIETCREIRSHDSLRRTLIAFLTARGEDYSQIAGFDAGADDYIAKPFSVREVLARVRSVLRRTAPQEGQSRAIAFEGLHMDLVRKICTVDGTPLALTKKEFEILALLLSNRGRIFSREEILHQVWSDEVIVLDRTIDVNITRLRRKIGVYGDHIVTRLGYGYGFEE